MKRKFKSALVLSSLVAFGAISTVSLTACGGEPAAPAVDITTLAINNKEAVAKDFYLDSADRKLEITLKDSQGNSLNYSKEQLAGNVKLVSSDEKVVSAQGSMVKATGVGTATITLSTADNKLKDSFDITITGYEPFEATSIKDCASLEVGAKVDGVRGKVVQIAYNGFWIAETVNGETSLVFIYASFGNIKDAQLGDTVVIRKGTVDVYSGLTQVKDPVAMYKDVLTPVEANITFEETAGDTYWADLLKKDAEGVKPISKPIPIKTTITLVFADGYKYYWKADNMTEDQVLYTGYWDTTQFDTSKLKVGDRFEATGFIGGAGSHSQGFNYTWKDRFNYYGLGMNKIDNVAITEINASIKDVKEGLAHTLLQREQVEFKYRFNTGAFATPEVIFTEGEDLLEVNAVSGVIVAKEGKAGTAKFKLKVGTVESGEFVITVTEDIYEPKLLSTVKSTLVKGATAFIDARFVKCTNTLYGNAYFADGSTGLYVYGTKNQNDPIFNTLSFGDGVTLKGTVDEYNGLLQLKNCEVVKYASTKAAAPEYKALTSTAGLTKVNSGDLYHVEGTYAAPTADDSYYKFKVTLEDASQIEIRAKKTNFNADDKTLIESFAEGDKISFDTCLGWFNKAQIDNLTNIKKIA